MAEKELTGKVAVVTGGGKGIGRAIASVLADHGAAIVACSRNQANLDAAVAEFRNRGAFAVARPVDITRQATIGRLAESIRMEFGKVDILVNNSGISGMTPMTGDNEQLWLEIINTNLNGLYFMTRSMLPLMPDGGRIINLSSVLGKFGVSGYGAYCTSKHGVIGFTRALSAELAPRKITVNAICPGWVDTDMSQEGITQIASQTGITEEEFLKEAMSRVPLGRFVGSNEVAALALYLAGPDSAAMTGQALNICGGATTN